MTQKPVIQKDVLQPVDDDARRRAAGLIRSARMGALAALEPGTGTPLASRVSVATAMDGRPVFLISRLSAHFGALEADPRASVLLGEAGAGDPLAHPRITVTGRAEMLAPPERDTIRARFLARHPKAALYADFADFAFWALRPDRASLNGGFGRAYALSAADITAPVPDGLADMEPGAVAHMNADHADAIQLYVDRWTSAPAGDWRMAGFDAQGMDLTKGDAVARVWFDRPLASADELRPRLVAMAKTARAAD
ncbi:MAG: DUF2470 domain-containing protein [Pseudomonadota bacterium]